MSTDRATIWLLDIDGVLNALTGLQGKPHLHWETLITKTVSTSRGANYCLSMAPEVISFITTQHAAGLDIRWATTWQNDANLFVAPAFALPTLPVGAAALGISDHSYKQRAARAAIEQGHPLIWTDDDAIDFSSRSMITASGVPHLLIEPDTQFGLTPTDLAAIAEFIATHR